MILMLGFAWRCNSVVFFFMFLSFVVLFDLIYLFVYCCLFTVDLFVV